MTSEDLFRTDATRAAGLEEDDPERDIRIYLTNLIKEAGVRNLLANRSQPPALLVSTTYRDSILNRTFCNRWMKRNGNKLIRIINFVLRNIGVTVTVRRVVALLHSLN